MLNPVIIFGAKGIANAALEIFRSNGVEVYCFLDNEEALHGSEIGNVSVLGAMDDDGYLKLIGKKTDAFVAVDDPKTRAGITEMLKDRRKVMPVNAIHNSVIMPVDFHIGHGNFLNAGVVCGFGVKLGNHCIINSGVVVDYSTRIGDHVQIGAGSRIGSGVEIAEKVLIGTGAVILPGLKIGKGAQIAPGSVVMTSVKAGDTVFGNPAKAI
jgi:sugar O-acyltransferase (sialic acid O-acetyltransferase NeuD family)